MATIDFKTVPAGVNVSEDRAAARQFTKKAATSLPDPKHTHFMEQLEGAGR